MGYNALSGSITVYGEHTISPYNRLVIIVQPSLYAGEAIITT